jgi:hypothetical protein
MSVFPTLDDEELAIPKPLGSRRALPIGEYLYRAGEGSAAVRSVHEHLAFLDR